MHRDWTLRKCWRSALPQTYMPCLHVEASSDQVYREMRPVWYLRTEDCSCPNPSPLGLKPKPKGKQKEDASALLASVSWAMHDQVWEHTLYFWTLGCGSLGWALCSLAEDAFIPWFLHLWLRYKSGLPSLLTKTEEILSYICISYKPYSLIHF